jgi:hypothetical protein
MERTKKPNRILAGLVVLAMCFFYFWYRCAAFIALHREIQSFGAWYESGDIEKARQDYRLMLFIPIFGFSWWFLGFWLSFGIYAVLVIINFAVYAIFKKRLSKSDPQSAELI